MENVQLYPAQVRLVPNFKLCKTSSVLTDDKYARMVTNGKKRKVVEKKNHKKFGDIRTVYSISNADGFDNTDPLTVFDYDVLSVCSSNICVGNFDITSAIIYRGLTGKVSNGSDAKPTQNLRDAIFNSITKLMGTIIDIDETAVNSAFHYGKDRPSITRSAILPCKYTKKTINGQETDVIHFDREPPFMTIARDRKQILTYDAALLDAPGINNSLMNIMLKNYVMRRVVEIKSHNQLKPILKFDTIFKYCRLENASRDTKMNARNVIVKFFKHIQAKGFIKSFELTKKNNAFYSITFKH